MNHTTGNALLNAFPSDVRAQLDVTEAEYPGHSVLLRSGEVPEWFYFPHHGAVISLTRSTESGATVEVGIVGYEGLVTVQALLTPEAAAATDAVVQIAGRASRVEAKAIRVLLQNPAVRDILMACTGAFLAQVSQHAVCNRLHTIEQRLAKWLLGVRDRIDSDSIGLTHDFLSHMLGIRRSGVTTAIGALALDGLIQHERSRIVVRDSEGLEDRACECYCVIRDATRQAELSSAVPTHG